MVLSDKAILRHMEKGNVVIDPFDRQNLSTSSYDVRLGSNYWREVNPDGGLTIFNSYSKKDVDRVWGSKPFKAERAEKWIKKYNLRGISPDDLIIWINAGETILAHTEEFIGGRNLITTMMKARSTWGRSFIEVCKCAGWGDVGYVNRWTMEITNNSRHYKIPLVVGRRIAQLAFFETEGIQNQTSDYTKSGKYQATSDFEKLKKDWNPRMMLPKLYLDREVKR